MSGDPTAPVPREAAGLLTRADVAEIEAELDRLARRPKLGLVGLGLGAMVGLIVLLNVLHFLGLIDNGAGGLLMLALVLLTPGITKRAVERAAWQRYGPVAAALDSYEGVEGARSMVRAMKALPRWVRLPTSTPPMMILGYAKILAQCGEWAGAVRAYERFFDLKTRWTEPLGSQLRGVARAGWAAARALAGETGEVPEVEDVLTHPEGVRESILYANTLARSVAALREGDARRGERILEQDLRRAAAGQRFAHRMNLRLLLAFARSRAGDAFRTPAVADEELQRWIADGRFDHLAAQWPELRAFLDATRP